MKRRSFLVLAAIPFAAGYAAEQKAAAATAPPRPAAGPQVSRAAAIAVAYAAAQVGHPYVWGGDGPGYDCSGLTYMAYGSAGIALPRTSQGQWAALPHVTSPLPGDLVFFPGGDGGTWSSPGHVAIVTGPHRIIQAYAAGTGVIASTYGLASSPQGTGAGTVIGYARPAA